MFTSKSSFSILEQLVLNDFPFHPKPFKTAMQRLKSF